MHQARRRSRQEDGEGGRDGTVPERAHGPRPTVPTGPGLPEGFLGAGHQSCPGGDLQAHHRAHGDQDCRGRGRHHRGTHQAPAKRYADLRHELRGADRGQEDYRANLHGRLARHEFPQVFKRAYVSILPGERGYWGELFPSTYGRRWLNAFHEGYVPRH